MREKRGTMGLRDTVLEILLGIFPILGILVPTFVAFRRKMNDEKYQSGGIDGTGLMLAGMHGFLWGMIGLLFTALIMKLLELRGIPVMQYVRRFWE